MGKSTPKDQKGISLQIVVRGDCELEWFNFTVLFDDREEEEEEKRMVGIKRRRRRRSCFDNEDASLMPFITPFDNEDASLMPFITPYLTKQDSFGNQVSWQVLDSTTYMFKWPTYTRSNYEETRQVYCWNSENINNSWTRGPTMIAGRSWPATIVVDGKLYVFGGDDFDHGDPQPWAEVLDPKIGAWQALPSPPNNRLVGREGWPGMWAYGYAVLENPKRIVIGSCPCLYIFNVMSKEWSEVSDFEFYSKYHHHCFGEAQVVDGSLYWISGDTWELKGYDLEQKMVLSARVAGLEEEKKLNQGFISRIQTFPIDSSSIGLIWAAFNPHEKKKEEHGGGYSSRIRCAKVRITRTSRGDRRDQIDAVCTSVKSFKVDHPVSLFDCQMRQPARPSG